MSEIRFIDTNVIIDLFGRTSFDEANGIQALDDWKALGHVVTTSTINAELFNVVANPSNGLDIGIIDAGQPPFWSPPPIGTLPPVVFTQSSDHRLRENPALWSSPIS